MNRPPLPYEVWMTQGQGGVCVAKTMSFDDALLLARVGYDRRDGSYAIRDTEKDEWCTWEAWKVPPEIPNE